MTNIKQTIREICFNSHLLKKIYCKISFIKGKVECRKSLVEPILKYKKSVEKPVFLIFTPEHANLGDHAIAFSEQIMLGEISVDYFEITGKKLYILDHFGYLNILNGFLILINGGGNLGMLWPDIEKMNRRIIESNPDSTIFILPNSIYYEKSKQGIEELEKSKIIYNSHKSLYLYAREKLSYDFMKSIYENVKLVPDMVLNLNEVKEDYIKRSGCLICLRSDIEKTLSIEEEKEVLHYINKFFGANFKYSDTVLEYDISTKERKTELDKKFDEFRSAQLIVTDRLHGMIFAAITGTNCIVLDSRSPKLKGCFQWISDLGYIRFIDDLSAFETECRILLSNKKNKFDNSKFTKYFDSLKKDILQEFKD